MIETLVFERLNKSHDKESFDCNHHDINIYLKTIANQHIKKNIAQTHVLIDNNKPSTIIGFYTLSAIDVELSLKGYPNKIPAMLIGRIGVDKFYQGQGFSKILLSHALNKIKILSLDAGIAFAIIDAKDDDLANYYKRLGFITTSMPLRLAMETKLIP